jgi:hypothetical protein
MRGAKIRLTQQCAQLPVVLSEESSLWRGQSTSPLARASTCRSRRARRKSPRMASAYRFGGVSTFSSFNRGCSSTSRASYIASVFHALLSFRRAYLPTAISRRACSQLLLCSRPSSVTNRYYGDTQCRIRDGAVLRLWGCCHARSATRDESSSLSDWWASCRMPGFRARRRRRVSRNSHRFMLAQGSYEVRRNGTLLHVQDEAG